MEYNEIKPCADLESGKKRSLLDIAFECDYYDHSHLANEIKRHTGLSPTQL